jgi:hypothetical protein
MGTTGIGAAGLRPRSETFRVIGVPWFSYEGYDAARAMMSDASELGSRYDGWLKQAELRVRDIEERGLYPVKAIIEAEVFASWCRGLGLPFDERARQAFANEQACRWYLEEECAGEGI